MSVSLAIQAALILLREGLEAILVLAALAALLIPAVRRDPATHVEPDVELRHPEAALIAGGTLVGDEPE